MTPTEIQHQCDEIVKLGEKATPGPWRRDRHSGYNCDVRAGNGRKVALCSGFQSTAAGPSKERAAENDANACLTAHNRNFAPAAAVALKVAIEALEKCVRDIEFWSNILDKEWSGFDGQLYAASNQARQALAAITNAFHE